MPGPDTTLDHFEAHGWMRVPGAFDASAAAAMRAAVWRVLAGQGIRPDDPASWSIERPTHLQVLKDDPAFRAVGSPVLLAAIGQIFAGRPWPMPRDWGACFIAFPGTAPWQLPVSGWHADAHYAGPLWPATGVKTLALFGDLGPRGGGTLVLGGSHRLVHDWFHRHPPPPGAHGADLRRALLGHPYLRDLHQPGEAAAREARFMAQSEMIDGIDLKVHEMVGAAGDIYLLHPLTLHCTAPNRATAPRFLLSGGVTTDQWGWG